MTGYYGSQGDIGYSGSSGTLPCGFGPAKISAQEYSSGAGGVPASACGPSFYPALVQGAGTSSVYVSVAETFQFNAASGNLTISGGMCASGQIKTLANGNFGSGLTVTGAITSTGGYNTCGSIVAKGNITGYGCFSDIRLKENIRPIADALEKLRTLQGVLYDWTDEFMEGVPGDVPRQDTGLIAQEVQKVLPEVIFIRENGYLGVKYEKVVGLIVQAINELADKVDAIEKTLAAE
jgi:hypothetical protein